MRQARFFCVFILALGLWESSEAQCCGSLSSSGGLTSFQSASCPETVPRADWEFQVTCSADGTTHTRTLGAQGECRQTIGFIGCYMHCDPSFSGEAVSSDPSIGHVWHATAWNTQIRVTERGGFLCPCECFTWVCNRVSSTSVTVRCPCAACTGGGGDGGGDTSDPGCRNQDGQVGGEDNCAEGTPIIISARGNGIRMTSAAGGVDFDLDGDGSRERLSWTWPGGDDAFLALDRNGNGRIDDGRELLGDSAPQPHSERRNGFEALRVFDAPENGGDDDGWISAGDRIFSRLLFWTDLNHDGISQATELRAVSRSRIDRFSLDYRESRRVDRHGNQFRYVATVHMVTPKGGSRSQRKFAVDVILVAQTGSTRE